MARASSPDNGETSVCQYLAIWGAEKGRPWEMLLTSFSFNSYVASLCLCFFLEQRAERVYRKQIFKGRTRIKQPMKSVHNAKGFQFKPHKHQAASYTDNLLLSCWLARQAHLAGGCPHFVSLMTNCSRDFQEKDHK